MLFIQYSWWILNGFLREYQKKTDTFNCQYFARIPNMASKLEFKQFEILTSHKKEKFQGKSRTTYHSIIVLKPDSKEGLGSCPK